MSGGVSASISPPLHLGMGRSGPLPAEGDESPTYDLSLCPERPRSALVDSQACFVHPGGGGAQFVVELLLLRLAAPDPKAVTNSSKAYDRRMCLHQQQSLLLRAARKPYDCVPGRGQFNTVLSGLHTHARQA